MKLLNIIFDDSTYMKWQKPMRSRSAAADIALLSGGTFTAKLVAVVSLGLFAHILSRDEMAIFPAFLMLAGLANLLFNFGIFPVFVKNLPELLRSSRERARGFVWTGSILIITGTASIALLCYFGADKFSDLFFGSSTFRPVIRIASLGFIPFAVCKIVEYLQWAQGRYAATSIVTVVEGIVRPTMTLLCFFSIGQSGIIWGLVASQFLLAALSIYLVRDFIAGALPRFQSVRVLLGQSFPYYLESYLMYARADGDNWLVTLLVSPHSLSEYYIAKTLYSNVFALFTSVDKVLTQRFALHLSNSEAFDGALKRANSMISEVAVPGIFFIIALTPSATVLIAGEYYHAASFPAALLLLVALAQFVAMPANRTLFLKKSGGIRLFQTGVDAFAVVIGSLMWASSWGISGIAASRLLGQSLSVSLGLLVLWLGGDPIGRLFNHNWFSALLGLLTTGFILVSFQSPTTAGSATVSAITCALTWILVYGTLSFIFDRRRFLWKVNFLKNMAGAALSKRAD